MKEPTSCCAATARLWRRAGTGVTPPFASSGPGEAVSHSRSVLTDTDQCFHTRGFVKDTDQPAPTLSGEAWRL